MCEESGWSKSCVAEFPAGDVATAFEGGVLTAKVVHLCLKNKQDANKKAQHITHCPWQCCFYVRAIANEVISVKKYQQNYSEF